MQRVLSYVRRAIDDYSMINEGDKIAVGVSGGKDSVTLALALKALSRFYPKSFEVVPVLLDMGFEGMDINPLRTFFSENEMELKVFETNIYQIVFETRKETNPCSLCANLRRGALNNNAKALGCNKVALGHHKDDVIETFFLSMFYEGRLTCFSPVKYLDRKDVFLIRPMIYMTENDILGFVNRNNIVTVKSTCPADGFTKRQYIKELLSSLSKENTDLKEHIFTAVKNSLDDWKIPKE